MFLIVGLGNPGEEYKATRHNAGAEALALFREQYAFPPFKRNTYIHGLLSENMIGKERVILLLPQTFMNRSGEAVRHMVQYLPNMPEIVVVHDDLDLPLGRIKLSFGRGAAGHKGVLSVMHHIGGNDFVRLRIGIGSLLEHDAGAEGAKDDEEGRDFVLGRFTEAEQDLYRKACVQGVEALSVLITEGKESTMQKFNAA